MYQYGSQTSTQNYTSSYFICRFIYQHSSLNTCTLILSRAWLLWEQFQKKSELFRENVLLVPHGDDFRYSDPREWEKQFCNLEKLMAYINSNTEMNTKVMQSCFFYLFIVKFNHSIEVYYQLFMPNFKSKFMLLYYDICNFM